MSRLTKEIGTLLATSKGDGLYAKRARVTVPLRLVATVDPDTVERGDDGRITFACCEFSATFDRSHWDTSRLGDMYTDYGISDAINAHLSSLGHTGRVGWSEFGRQEETVADFDMDYALVDELWPELDRAVSPPTPAAP